MLKKIFAYILVFTLLFASLVFPVKANESEIEIKSDYFYKKLTSTEQIVYDAVLSSTGGIYCKVPGTVEIDFPRGEEIVSFTTKDALQEILHETVIAALTSLISDHPELYWLGNYGFNYVARKNGITYQISSFSLFLFSDVSWEQTEKNYYKVLDAATNITIKGNTTYEQVKSIHDSLCKMISYPSDLSNLTTETTVYGALLPPYSAVCEGYAEAFKLLCSLNGIECVTVFGESAPAKYILGIIQIGKPSYHEWNYVKMDDGKWYGLDLTWDDQGSAGIFYDFFLSGSQTVAESFGEESFIESHKPTGKLYDSKFSLSYPTLNKSAYIPRAQESVVLGDVNSDGSISVVDAKLILQSVAGLKALNSAQKTNADVNGDSKITVTDAKWILQAIAGLKTF